MGTPNFIPPELFLSGKKEKVDPYSADIWSFGETIFRSLTSQVSFTNSQMIEYCNDYIGFPDQVLRRLAISDNAIDFLGQVMTAAPSRRLTADQANMHPWINGNFSFSTEYDSAGSQHNENKIHSWLPERPSQSIDELTQASGTWNTVIERHPPAGIEEDGMNPEKLGKMGKSAKKLYMEKKYNEAESQYQQIIKLSTNLIGERDPHTHDAMNNLADTYRQQGKYDKAERIYQDTMKLRIKVLGNEHPDTLGTIDSLAINYQHQGRHDEAEQLFQDTMELRIKVLGNEHPDTLNTMNSLAYNYRYQQKYDEAEQLYRDTIDLRRKVFGNENPGTLATIVGLAFTYKQKNKYEKAKRLYRDVVEVQKVVDKQHPKTLQAMRNLVEFLDEQRDVLKPRR